jgi:hypothetical protein
MFDALVSPLWLGSECAVVLCLCFGVQFTLDIKTEPED